jgi:hypothetical protein
MTARRPREGSIWEVLLFAILFVLAFSAIARADGGGLGGSMMTAVAKPAVSDYVFGASIDWTTARRLLDNDTDKPGYSASYESLFTGTYKPWNVTLSAAMEYDQEYTYENDDGSPGVFANPSFALTKAWKNKTDFSSPVFDSIAISLRSSLPGNQKSYNQSFEGSIGPGFSVAKKIGRFSISERVTYSRSSFEYETSTTGKVNSPDSYGSKTVLEYAITDKWSLNSVLVYGYAINFLGDGTGTQDVSGNISYKIGEHYSIALGLDTERGTSAEDQQEQIRLYDENSTQVFVSLSASI